MRWMMFAQRFGSVTYLALARQEDQDIAGANQRKFIDSINDRIHQIALFTTARRTRCGCRDSFGLRTLLYRPLYRSITHFHRIQASRDFNHRRRCSCMLEMLCKTIGINGGRGDDQLQIRPARQQLLEITQQEVNVQTALVSFIDDQRVVLPEQRITLRLGEQNAVSHQLDPRALGQGVIETHLVAYVHAGWRAEFLSDTLGC